LLSDLLGRSEELRQALIGWQAVAGLKQVGRISGHYHRVLLDPGLRRKLCPDLDGFAAAFRELEREFVRISIEPDWERLFS
jgi:hypothetical protein